MQLNDLILMILGSSDEPIAGRTAIQKITYFASIKTGLEGEFRPHYYGPYSSGVASLIEELSSTGFIAEDARRTVNNRVMFSYSLTSDGERLVSRLKKKQPEAYKMVSAVVKKCRSIAHNDIAVLSWSAKYNFLQTSTGQKLSYSEARETSKQFGWQLPEKEFESGVKLLRALRLKKEAKE
jgi:uncharacterized protein YwgA